MGLLYCSVHGGCLVLYYNYPAGNAGVKNEFELKMSIFPLLVSMILASMCRLLFCFPPEGQKGSQSPQTMVIGTVACARSRTARRRSSASCVTSGKGRQPGKNDRGQRAVASRTDRQSDRQTDSLPRLIRRLGKKKQTTPTTPVTIRLAVSC